MYVGGRAPVPRGSSPCRYLRGVGGSRAAYAGRPSDGRHRPSTRIATRRAERAEQLPVSAPPPFPHSSLQLPYMGSFQSVSCQTEKTPIQPLMQEAVDGPSMGTDWLPSHIPDLTHMPIN
eukprot:GHVU01012000.1.p2 GENE.GHVU01012000.1~~GHVU01012000.1.p2  ORF type:complete len:120 (+),score=0.55 GHVU01012000.1:248-607(+)